MELGKAMARRIRTSSPFVLSLQRRRRRRRKEEEKKQEKEAGG